MKNNSKIYNFLKICVVRERPPNAYRTTYPPWHGTLWSRCMQIMCVVVVASMWCPCSRAPDGEKWRPAAISARISISIITSCWLPPMLMFRWWFSTCTLHNSALCTRICMPMSTFRDTNELCAFIRVCVWWGNDREMFTFFFPLDFSCRKTIERTNSLNSY